MNIEKTRQYYEQLTEEDICDCAYCQNYVKEVKTAYVKLTAYLDKLGIDVEKPFEAIPVGLTDGKMFYSGVQYVVLGQDDFEETVIDEVNIFITDSHPMTGISEDHFVIEIAPVYLRWTGEE